MKRHQESEPTLISVIFFISALSERNEKPLLEKWEMQENCQSINMFDDKGLDPQGIGNLPSISQSRFGVRR